MATDVQPVLKHSVHTLVFRSLKRTHDMFLSDEGKHIPEDQTAWVLITAHYLIVYLAVDITYLATYFVCYYSLSRLRMKIACKVHDEHDVVKHMQPPIETTTKTSSKSVSVPAPSSGIYY